MRQQEKAFNLHIIYTYNKELWDTTQWNTQEVFISNGFSRGHAPAPPKNRVFPQLTGIPWCNIPGVNHLQRRAGDQNDHITTAGLLCGGRSVDLGDFHFLMSKHMNILQNM